MYARVARYKIDPERCNEAVERFEAAGDEIAVLEGYRTGLLLVDPDSGEMMTITVWESQWALEASEVRATRLRQGAAREVDGEVQSVHRFNVAVPLGVEIGQEASQ